MDRTVSIPGVLTSELINIKLRDEDMKTMNQIPDKKQVYSVYKRIKLKKNEDGDSLCCKEWLED